MPQYVLKGASTKKYFAGYYQGVAYFSDKSDAITFSTVKEADNYISALRKGGVHETLVIEGGYACNP